MHPSIEVISKENIQRVRLLSAIDDQVIMSVIEIIIANCYEYDAIVIPMDGFHQRSKILEELGYKVNIGNVKDSTYIIKWGPDSDCCLHAEKQQNGLYKVVEQ